MRRLLPALGAIAICALAAPALASARQYSAQVVGGSADRQTDVQWVAAVLYPGPGDRARRQGCGGSLVAARYVLTAAHCVSGENPSALQVLLGTKNLNRGGKVIRVRRGFVYPGYRRSDAFGDMALLKLRRKAGYRPVRLVRAGQDFVGSQGYIAGWGSTTGGNSYPLILQSAWVPIRPAEACIERYWGYAPSVMLCAGAGTPDACYGDSGGPLASRVNGRWRLVGATSFGEGCGIAPGVYAWVGSPQLRSWLRSRLGL